MQYEWHADAGHPHWMVRELAQPTWLRSCRLAPCLEDWLRDHCGDGVTFSAWEDYRLLSEKLRGELGWVVFWRTVEKLTGDDYCALRRMAFITAFREFNHAVLYKLRYG